MNDKDQNVTTEIKVLRTNRKLRQNVADHIFELGKVFRPSGHICGTVCLSEFYCGRTPVVSVIGANSLLARFRHTLPDCLVRQSRVCHSLVATWHVARCCLAGHDTFSDWLPIIFGIFVTPRLPGRLCRYIRRRPRPQKRRGKMQQLWVVGVYNMKYNGFSKFIFIIKWIKWIRFCCYVYVSLSFG